MLSHGNEKPDAFSTQTKRVMHVQLLWEISEKIPIGAIQGRGGMVANLIAGLRIGSRNGRPVIRRMGGCCHPNRFGDLGRGCGFLLDALLLRLPASHQGDQAKPTQEEGGERDRGRMGCWVIHGLEKFFHHLDSISYS